MSDQVTVERLSQYSDIDAREIGLLLPSLSSSFPDTPIERNLLEDIIDSPYHCQIVARIEGRIVGTATLSITIGIGAGRKAYLEDFVVDTTLRAKGIGSAIWDEITRWCIEQDVPLHFTSRTKRQAAHKFYLTHGSTTYDTVVFHYDPR